MQCTDASPGSPPTTTSQTTTHHRTRATGTTPSRPSRRRCPITLWIIGTGTPLNARNYIARLGYFTFSVDFIPPTALNMSTSVPSVRTVPSSHCCRPAFLLPPPGFNIFIYATRHPARQADPLCALELDGKFVLRDRRQPFGSAQIQPRRSYAILRHIRDFDRRLRSEFVHASCVCSITKNSFFPPISASPWTSNQ
jgi:hypothetical protein